ncbi:MAG: ABC transporter substrate-binding protein [Alphaproteobacteria bacterium]|nr:ABC transporter substrate-binding protein [Alphaproteobacteria bacterium]
MQIRVRCSPDADDLFMMRALLEGHLDTGPYTFVVDTAPTDALNRLASGDDSPEVCAISIAHLPFIAERYQLLPHGGSMGEGYGPVVVAKQPMSPGDLVGRRVGIPGTTTSAWATLQFVVPELTPVVVPIVPYRGIFDALEKGEVDAGLLIHEGRLTYEEMGLAKVVDLGEWWAAHTGGLPLPLGGNAIARRLGPEHIGRISGLLRASIAHALGARDEAIAWLLQGDTALRTPEKLSEYLDMYANGRTLDYGPDGREAIERFLAETSAAGILPPVTVDYAP